MTLVWFRFLLDQELSMWSLELTEPSDLMIFRLKDIAYFVDLAQLRIGLRFVLTMARHERRGLKVFVYLQSNRLLN